MKSAGVRMTARREASEEKASRKGAKSAKKAKKVR
jgi:hypothetical protein